MKLSAIKKVSLFTIKNNYIERMSLLSKPATLLLSGLLFVSCSKEKQDQESQNVSIFEKAENKIKQSRKSGFEMVEVEGGEFMMGGDDGIDDGGDPKARLADECPHPVQVDDFSIGKYEITQSDWFEVMGTYPSEFKGCGDCPVEQVSWEDIQQFIAKVNLIYASTYRLPTEAEWEFAARGGIKSQGYTYAGSNNIKEVAWYQENASDKPHPVGELLPNELGIYDMSGNIWEWISENKVPYPCDSIGKVFDSKVLRGGSFSHRAESLRVKDRNGRSPNMRLQTLGFRLAQ